MDHLPIMLTVRDRPCLVVGGGAVAARKVALLQRAGARVRVVAPRLHPTLRETPDLHHAAEPFDAATHLRDGLALVVAATNDETVNRAASRAALAAGIPVNVVDNPALSSFIVPAIVERGPLTIAIGSGGAAPVLARRLRARIEALLPQGLGELARIAGNWRERVRARLPDAGRRRRFWEDLLDHDWEQPGCAFPTREVQVSALLERHVGAAADHGEVALVGCGPGDPELLTLKALRALQRADVILHDRLIPVEVLDYARRDAERIAVGKRRGHHSVPQAAIQRLLVKHARRGRRVVRLKGGDPFIFGRGGEEVEALRAAGVRTRVIPGISAVQGAAAELLRPLTRRGLARQLVLASGHDDGDAAHWATLARRGQTVAFYMGLDRVATLCRQLRDHGLPGNHPAVMVAGAGRPEGRHIDGDLATLPQRVAAAGLESPALLLVGEAVAAAPAAATQLRSA